MLARSMHAAVVILLSREGVLKLRLLGGHCRGKDKMVRLRRVVFAVHLPPIVYNGYRFGI